MNVWTRLALMGWVVVAVAGWTVGDVTSREDRKSAAASTENAKPKPDAAKTALQFVIPADTDISDYLKKNKCVIGSWEMKKKTDYGWEGNLHYACANHKPGGVRYIEGPIKVLMPAGVEPPMDAKFDGFGNQVVLRESKKEGYHEIVAFVVPMEKVKGKQWLEGVGDLDWAGIYQKKYRYAGMVPDAMTALQSKEATARVEAARVLASLGSDANEALSTLLEQVAVEKDNAGREAMVRAIATVGYGETEKIMPTVISLLGDEVIEVRIAAAQAVAFQGDKGKAAIDPLIKATADQSKVVRIEAVRALAHLGVEEPRVITHLEKLSKGDDVAVRQAARRALQKIDSDTPLPVEQP